MKFVFLACSMLLCALLQAQRPLGLNDLTGNVPVRKVLNAATPFSMLPAGNDKLLIVDFFGTWCVPCRKAIPNLTAMQSRFENEISIVLVSIETEAKLTEFLKKQSGFSLPVIVDQEQNFTKIFQPPSYPYTVVVAANGTILAIPSAEEMTAENITKWLAIKGEAKPAMAAGASQEAAKPLTSIEKKNTSEMQSSNTPLVKLSQDFIYAAKTGDATEGFVEQLNNIPLDSIKNGLKTDDEKKAFWINLYNAYTQVLLKANPDAYSKRSDFFGGRQIEIAGRSFSLDDIEHGILRRSKLKWSLGYLNKLFPGKTERALRVDRLDYRLHFALNCGAKSCPPIAFYKPETINQQLDLATKAYLTSEAEYDASTNIVRLPALMSWFRGDFGGKKKTKRLLQQLSIIPAEANPKFEFKKYDWTLYLKNYKS
ncbi:MAG: DUF547 domain-containing protein [Chitinophagaceae bacterium]